MEIIIIGGDRRMIFAAKKLAEQHDCALCGFEKAKVTGVLNIKGKARFGCAVLPIFARSEEIQCPYGDGNMDISVLTDYLEPGAAVFAGKVFPALEELCRTNGYELYDYLKREEFAVMNAVLTAEAAASIAVWETEHSVFGADVLILGYGRIGKLTARYFSSLGAQVTAAARKPCDIAWIKAQGCTAVDITNERELTEALSKADIILNTVPAGIITGGRAEAVNREALLIELASVPCTDGTAEFRVVNAGGLPGKTAPVTAGYIIAGTIENIMDERRKQNGGA